MKKLVSLVLAVGAVFILGSCGSSGEDSKKESLVDLKATEIPVQEDGTFVIEGTMKNTGTIITVAGNTMPIVADSDGNFTHTIQMGDVVDSADLVAKYNNDEQTIKLKFDTSKYEAALAKSSESQETEETTVESTAERIEDITKLSTEPTSDQKLILQNLANQKFNQDYPIKGSKLHTLAGRIQDWTAVDDHWFAKIEATVANDAGAKQDMVAEFTITPTDASSGTVTLDVY